MQYVRSCVWRGFGGEGEDLTAFAELVQALEGGDGCAGAEELGGGEGGEGGACY